MVDVYTVENHMISCTFDDIPSQMSGVQWNPLNQPGGPINSYTKADGAHSGTSQTSTLTISSGRLSSLKGSSRSHTFTCRINVGKSNTPITATQTISIYTPSEISILQLIFDDSILQMTFRFMIELHTCFLSIRVNFL